MEIASRSENRVFHFHAFNSLQLSALQSHKLCLSELKQYFIIIDSFDENKISFSL